MPLEEGFFDGDGKATERLRIGHTYFRPGPTPRCLLPQPGVHPFFGFLTQATSSSRNCFLMMQSI